MIRFSVLPVKASILKGYIRANSMGREAAVEEIAPAAVDAIRGL
jgi:hypothetical protein